MPDESVSVVCPHCNARLKLKDSSAIGTRIKCPKCTTAFIAAAAGAPAPVAAAAAGAGPVKKKRPPAEEPPENEVDDEDGEQPKKKKKKKKKKKQQAGMSLPLIVGISAFVFLLLAGGVIAAVVMSKGGGGSRGAMVAVPELTDYTGPTFSLITPKGWENETGGAENYQYVICKNGPVMVKGQDDSAGVGDITAGPNRGERNEDQRLEVVEGVHLGKGETLKEDLDDYQEEPPVRFDAKIGMGRWSEFSYSEGMFFKTKMKGIRATVQSNTRTVVVRCVCPEKMWETFKPIFIKIATSVGPGRRA